MKPCCGLLVASLCLLGSCAAMGIPQPLDIKSADLGLPPKVFPTTGFKDDLVTKANTVKPEVPADVKVNGTKVHAPEESTEKVTVASPVKQAVKKDSDIATEVSDMLTDSYNRTVYDDTTEDSPLQNDTVTVTGPHVVDNGKTHEEAVNKSTAETTTVSTTEEHQNVTVDAGTTGAVTTEHSNDTVVHNITDLSTAASTTLPPQDRKVKTKDDNKTVKEESTTVRPSSTSTAEETTSKTKEATSSAEETTSKTKEATPSVHESTSITKEATPEPQVTTPVNISENVIEHKADMPVALAASQEHADHDHASNGKSSAFLQPTESAAILAGVFVAIALIGYVGLLVWRRMLEKRYGNREMLVNEDDFYDTNDLRNFEL